MEMSLRDRVVLVTGGSDGLGLATAHGLVAGGARVAVCGRDGGRLDRAVAELEGAGGQVLGCRADVTNSAQLSSVFKQVGEEWGRLDGLVNGAGRHTGQPFAETTDEEWQADFELKLLAAIRGCRSALELMGTDGGSIVNVLSIFARTPGAGSMPSSVFRAAGLALTKALSHELAPSIRVNAILVGFMESGQTERGAAAQGVPVPEYSRAMVQKLGIPLGRQGTAREFADLACYLLSPSSAYVTGAAIPIDGGLSPAI